MPCWAQVPTWEMGQGHVPDEIASRKAVPRPGQSLLFPPHLL